MEAVKLALVGCGGIAGAHVRALQQLREHDLHLFNVVATCDIDADKAEERAVEIEAFQAKKPTIFTDLGQLLNQLDEIDAVDICTLHAAHHELAIQCLDHGKAVHIEKPLAITLRAGKKILDAAIAAKQLLAVGENYRRAPAERAFQWAIRQGHIGQPRSFYWHDVNEGLGKWGWRNFKHAAGAGWVLDGGVHFADLFRFHLGTEAQQVSATVRQYEPYRYDTPATREGAWRVDVEDATFAHIHFDNNVVVQWTWQGTAPGQGFNKRVLYGSEGCLDWDSGFWARDNTNITKDDLISAYMDSLTDDAKAKLFPGGITDAIAVELADFATSVQHGTVPEVDGSEGYKAQAICLAIFESAHLNRPVTLQEVESLEVEGYQHEINEALGLY